MTITPTYIPIATTTLASAASSVTFGSIPATYRDLVLISVVKQTVFINHNMRLNGDTGSNYSGVQMFGDGGSAISNTFNATYFSPFLNTNPGTGNFLSATTVIMDYSATDKHKTILMRSAGEGAQFFSNASASAFRWASTAAVNQISIFPASGSIDIGSTFSIYGIAG